jgi:hypothetical protein
MSYDVDISSDSYSGYLSASLDYEHQQDVWSISPSFSYPAGGSISISNSSDFDDVNVLESWHS